MASSEPHPKPDSTPSKGTAATALPAAAEGEGQTPGTNPGWAAAEGRAGEAGGPLARQPALCAAVPSFGPAIIQVGAEEGRLGVFRGSQAPESITQLNHPTEDLREHAYLKCSQEVDENSGTEAAMLGPHLSVRFGS